jgi:hypothetical protein
MKRQIISILLLTAIFFATSCKTETDDPNRLDVNESRTIEVMSEEKWNVVSIDVIAGETYSMVSSGQWTDLTTVTDADGYDDPVLDLFSNLKRNTDAKWFELVAAIDTTNMYVVGSNDDIMFNQSGSLSFFANDAEDFYGNNSGSISTVVTRIE